MIDLIIAGSIAIGMMVSIGITCLFDEYCCINRKNGNFGLIDRNIKRK